jgi:hypothetical protein
MAVVAPMPSARVAIAANGNAGARRKLRRANRRSWNSVSIEMPPERDVLKVYTL